MGNIKKYIKKTAYWLLMVSMLLALFNSMLCNEKPIIAKIGDSWSFPALKEFGSDLGILQLGNDMVLKKYSLASIAIYPPIKYSYDFINRSGLKYAPPMTQGPNGKHILGTDRLGRDVLAGVVRGFYISFKIGLISLLFAAIFGVIIGLCMGYFGNQYIRWSALEYLAVLSGILLALFYFIYPISKSLVIHLGFSLSILCFFWLIKFVVSKLSFNKYPVPLDFTWLKIIELLKSIPALIILLVALPLFNSRGAVNIIVILAFLVWKNFARHSRAETFAVKEEEFVLNAKAQGQSDWSIIFRQILPNILPTILVLASFTFASLILLESSLSFLGLGLPIGEVSWGSLLAEGRTNPGAWWLSVFPGLSIFLVILCINLIVDKKLSIDE